MARGKIVRFARARVASQVRRFVPDPHDPRYPRPRWLRVPRAAAGFSWVLLVLYLANVLASGLLQVLRHGLASVSNLTAIFQLLLVDRVVSALGDHLVLLIPLGAGGLAAILIWRWALEDQTREARVLLLRDLRRPTATRLAKVLGRIGWHWLRRRMILVVLVVACVLGGVILALLNIPDRGILP